MPQHDRSSIWNLAVIVELFRQITPDPIRILEVGSWEGYSAGFFLSRFPGSHITCVDTFAGPWEEKFDTYLSQFGNDRFEKRSGSSVDVLTQLALEGDQYDLIYIDGDHTAAAVYQDTCLSWSMLRNGGLMVFDDYEWKPDRGPMGTPKLAIDAFLARNAERYQEIHREWHVVVRKT